MARATGLLRPSVVRRRPPVESAPATACRAATPAGLLRVVGRPDPRRPGTPGTVL